MIYCNLMDQFTTALKRCMKSLKTGAEAQHCSGGHTGLRAALRKSGEGIQATSEASHGIEQSSVRQVSSACIASMHVHREPLNGQGHRICGDVGAVDPQKNTWLSLLPVCKGDRIPMGCRRGHSTCLLQSAVEFEVAVGYPARSASFEREN